MKCYRTLENGVSAAPNAINYREKNKAQAVLYKNRATKFFVSIKKNSFARFSTVIMLNKMRRKKESYTLRISLHVVKFIGYIARSYATNYVCSNYTNRYVRIPISIPLLVYTRMNLIYISRLSLLNFDFMAGLSNKSTRDWQVFLVFKMYH